MDLSAIDLKRSLIGTLGILVAVVFVGLLGPAGLLAALCAVFLGVLDQPDSVRERIMVRARFIAIGSVVVGLLSWSGERVGWATLVAGVVTYVGTLGAGWGRRAATEGQFLVLLAVVTLMVGSTDLSEVALAVAFAAGGVLATAVALIGGRWAGDVADGTGEVTGTDADVVPGDRPIATDLDPRSIAAVARSAIGTFAVARAVAVAVATASGFRLFENHPVWAMLTVVLVLQPPPRQTWRVGLQRTAGTVVGVLVGILVVVALDPSTAAVAVAFVLAGFGMMAFTGVDYTVSTVFTTCVLLFSQRILQEDTFATGWERIGATVLGTGIALVVVAAAILLDLRSTASPIAGTP